MLLGIDLGTSSVKVALMAEDGSVKKVGSAGYAMDSPHPGWAETDPAAWWVATREAVTSLGAKHLRAVEAIGLSGQMHGVVLTHEDGRPVRPAILWADARSTQEVDRYRRLGSELLRRLANPPTTGMAGPILLWLKRHESKAYESARWALQPKDWLRMRLTGGACAEPTDASATLLYDFVDDGWSREALRELDLRVDLLPGLIASQEVAGRLTQEVAEQLGIRPGIPVAAGAADTAASLLGQGVVAPGRVVLTIGTGAQMTAVRNELRPDAAKRTYVFRAVEKRQWYAMSAILNAGLALDWVRRIFGVEWDALYASIEQVRPGAGGVTFIPYLVSERTLHFDSGAGASWSGMALHHGREHLLKAALEGVAFALREAMEALEATGIAASELLLSGGGTEGAPWRQLLADVLNKRLVAVASPAGAARGAALLAGLAGGTYKTVGETAVIAPRYELAAEPGPQSDEYARLYERHRFTTRSTAR